MDLKEKYRPYSFNSEWLIKTEEIKYIESMHPNYPHLLFSGYPGTGKTTTAKIIAKELHGSEWQEYTMLLNGSDETSVEVVRGKIKDFARSYAPEGGKRVIILDEAEYMSANAQNALRGMMEMYSDNALFILTCNNENKIIKPLKDDENGRCHHIRFKLPPSELVVQQVKRIAQAEGIEVEEGAVELAVQRHGAKLRLLLDMLQACGGVLTREHAEGAVVDRADIILTYIQQGYVRDAVELALTVPPRRLTTQLMEKVLNMDLGEKKVKLVQIIAEHDYRFAVGAEVTVQVPNLIYSLAYVLHVG